MQLLRRMGDQVAQFVHRATLHRTVQPQHREGRLQALAAIDDQQLGPVQAARLEVLQQIAPRRLALSGQRSESQRHLLSIGSHPQGHQNRQRRALPIEAHIHHGAVEDQPRERLALEAAVVPALEIPLYPTSGTAHGVLAHRPAKEPAERRTLAACVHAGQVGARDQCARRACQALVARQQPAVKLSAATVLATPPCLRHRQFHSAERADHGPWPVAVPIALGALGTPVPQPSERLGDFLLGQLLEELAHPAAHLLLDLF